MAKPRRKSKAKVEPTVPAVIGRPTEYKPEYCERLLAHMAQGLSFEGFAGEVRVSFQTLYSWRDKYPAFLEAMLEGRSLCFRFHEQVSRNIGMGIVPAPPPGARAVLGNARMQMFMLAVHGKAAGYGELLERRDPNTPPPAQIAPPPIVFEYRDDKQSIEVLPPEDEDPSIDG